MLKNCHREDSCLDLEDIRQLFSHSVTHFLLISFRYFSRFPLDRAFSVSALKFSGILYRWKSEYRDQFSKSASNHFIFKTAI